MAKHGFLVRGLLLGILLIPQVVQASAYMRVVSWNLRHEGWPDDLNYTGDAAQIWNQYGTTSTSTNGCDIVFAQEVMYESAAQGITSELTRISGFPWAYAVTPPLGRSASYKELYAVIYRTDRVSLLSNTIYNDVNDVFEREPQIVKVRDKSTGADFTFVNWHSIFGTTTERQAEVSAVYQVFQSVQNSDPNDQDVILLGDCNTSATTSWWSSLIGLSPQVSYRVNDLTTINTSGGYVSAYDHFWLQSTYVTEYSNSGRDYVADPLSFQALGTGMSDHAPVWLRLYSTSDTD
ncbi:MAG TPA: deoxyribonuclease I [Polyangia bacterium]|jgi:endonuclease/exonuclease/phosphatase family metal-dependent hydrolase|nr:deoxyribonuclease I [Polyangia bacterium]